MPTSTPAQEKTLQLTGIPEQKKIKIKLYAMRKDCTVSTFALQAMEEFMEKYPVKS